MDAIDIDITIEQLAAAVEGQPSTIRIWTVARLASALGLDAILSDTDDPWLSITEVGEMWIDGLAELLEDAPDRQADTFRAAQAVLRRLLLYCPGS